MENYDCEILSDENLRLKCLEFVVESGHQYNFPVYQMIGASMLFRYIKSGTLPVIDDVNADDLILSAIEQLSKKREDAQQATRSGDPNADRLEVPKKPVSFFAKVFGRK